MCVLGVAVAVSLAQHRELERDGEVREIVSGAITSKVRRQHIGDQGVIEKGIRTGWEDAFAHEGERFLASFAIPGIPATVRTTNVAALEEALKRKVEAAESDGIEARQIKAMVEGMKDELRRFVAAGGTIEQYGRRLVARQNDEIAMYTEMRLGDCCKLTWAEVDIVRSVVQKVHENEQRCGIHGVACLAESNGPCRLGLRGHEIFSASP